MSAAPNAPDPIAALRDKFSVGDTAKSWLVRCAHCGKRWSLEKPAEGEKMHPGNVLALLNHAAGHRRPL